MNRSRSALLTIGYSLLVSTTLSGDEVVRSISWQELATAGTLTSGTVVQSSGGVDGPSLRVVHNGKLYRAEIQIWNAAPDYCPSCGWYTLLGTCGTGGTCSVLPAENQDRVAAFLARHPHLACLDLGRNWPGPRIPGLAADFRAAPATTGTDGFYCAGCA